MNVIGCLMKNTLLLAQVDRYKLEPRDFDSRFTKIVFSSIYNMYLNGARTITEIDLSNYLDSNRELKAIFEAKENNGIQYLQDCQDLAEEVNFDYNYKRVKKFSALRALQSDGFDISGLYCDSPLDSNYSKIQENFDKLGLDDIFTYFKKTLLTLEDDFVSNASSESKEAVGGIRLLKEQLKISPEIGYPLQGTIFNSVVRGARKGKFYLRSAGSGVGKTRLAVGDACGLAYPIFYDTYTNSWIDKGYSEKVLFITTELDFDEIQTMILANISGINEDNILNGFYTMEEEERVDKAISIMEEYKTNFILAHIPDPSIGQIESCVRKNCLVNGVENVFYDYIFSSPSLLNEFSSLKIREDVILGMMSTALKDLAVELGVFMESSTQLSGDIEMKKGIRDQRFLRGAKSIADKADIGAITAKIVGEELQIIQGLCQRQGFPIPNMVTDVYKARRSKYKDVKIWSKIDLGTCRVEDLFITDAYYNPINDFKELKISDFSTSGEIIENFSVKEKRKEEPPEKESPQIKKTLSLDDF